MFKGTSVDFLALFLTKQISLQEDAVFLIFRCSTESSRSAERASHPKNQFSADILLDAHSALSLKCLVLRWDGRVLEIVLYGMLYCFWKRHGIPRRTCFLAHWKRKRAYGHAMLPAQRYSWKFDVPHLFSRSSKASNSAWRNHWHQIEWEFVSMSFRSS